MHKFFNCFAQFFFLLATLSPTFAYFLFYSSPILLLFEFYPIYNWCPFAMITMGSNKSMRTIAKKNCEPLCHFVHGCAEFWLLFLLLFETNGVINIFQIKFPSHQPSITLGVANEIHTPPQLYSVYSYCKTIGSANCILWIFDFDMCPLYQHRSSIKHTYSLVSYTLYVCVCVCVCHFL